MNVSGSQVHNSAINRILGLDAQESYVLSVASDVSAWIRSFAWWQITIAVIGLILLYDQIVYLQKKGNIAGPRFKVWPIIGPFLESMDPKFEEYEAKWRSGPLSCVSVFHKFVVIASTRDLARKVLNSPAYVKPCVVDVAIKLLRPTNWVFKDGKEHLEYRKSLNPLFTRTAISVYLPTMEKVYDQYFEKWTKLSEEKGPMVFMNEFREINCANSLRTFCGPYVTEEEILRISDNYYKITAALELVNFPIILPFTKTWYGKKITDLTMDILANCAQMSKDHIAAGGEVTCVMDAWIKLMHDSKLAAQAGNLKDNEDGIQRSLTREFSNKEISETVFTFLFASQDATSSATTWLFQIIADRPEVMKKIYNEQLAVRGNNRDTPLTIDLVDSMEYTNMVVRECLRFRPPVSMVPYVVKRDFPVTDTYTAPKGSMIIPTLHPSLHDPEIYENPEEFIPERWAPGSPANKATSNWIVFGTGPHYCLGQKYVFLHLTAMMGKAVMNYDWTHTVTPESEKIKVFATIFPQDDCILSFKRRVAPPV